MKRKGHIEHTQIDMFWHFHFERFHYDYYACHHDDLRRMYRIDTNCNLQYKLQSNVIFLLFNANALVHATIKSKNKALINAGIAAQSVIQSSITLLFYNCLKLLSIMF
jgi:hypothetical protein